QRPAVHAEAAAGRGALRSDRGRRVEGAGRRRLPVHDERLVVLVHPAAPDVERIAARGEVDPPEAESALRVLEGGEPAGAPGLEHRLVDLADGGAARLRDLAAHLLETLVRVIDVRLLGPELPRLRVHATPSGRRSSPARSAAAG